MMLEFYGTRMRRIRYRSGLLSVEMTMIVVILDKLKKNRINPHLYEVNPFYPRSN